MDMNMSSMDMPSMTGTTSAAASSATGAAMSMGGMDMGGNCKISMLWNWYTVDSCFLASSWHVRSAGAFAGSCIGVVLLVMILELLRRVQREFDRYLHRANIVVSNYPGENDSTSKDGLAASTSVADRLKAWQHIIRSLLYMFQFAVGYFVMLLAMYFNGYIIISIFIGAFLGSLAFQWDTYNIKNDGPETKDSCCC